MTSLKQILRQYSGPPTIFMGSDVTHATEPPSTILDKENLQRDLEVLRSGHQRYFALCVGLILILFFAGLWAMFNRLGQPGLSQFVSLAFATGTPGLIVTLIKLVNDRTKITLLLLLIKHEDSATIKTVVETLARQS